VVSGLPRMYTYRHQLFAELRPDNGLGVLLADFLFVPFACASLVTLLSRHRLLTTVAFVALLPGIEVVFVRQGIFLHHRWSLWHTSLLFEGQCGLAIWWLGICERRGYTPTFRWLVVVASTIYGWCLWAVTSAL
jgi:hypothetical protein